MHPAIGNIFSDLMNTLSDLERQTKEIWRWRYYGEAKGLIRSLVRLDLSSDDVDMWHRRCRSAFEVSTLNDGAEDSGERPSDDKWIDRPVERYVS